MAKTKSGTKKTKKTTAQKLRSKVKSAVKKIKKKLINAVPKKRGRPRKLDKLKNSSKRGRPKKQAPSFPGTEPKTPPPVLPAEAGV